MSGLRKSFFTSAFLAVALAHYGCQPTVSTIVSDINAVSGALSSSQTTQAAATSRRAAGDRLRLFGRRLARPDDREATPWRQAAGEGHDESTVPSAVCLTLGGASVGAATVPATATPVVAAPAPPNERARLVSSLLDLASQVVSSTRRRR